MFKKSLQSSTFCILHPACVLLSVCSLHFTLSLHFTPGPQSAVCSLQSAVRCLRFTLTGSEYYILRKLLGVKFHIINIYMTTIRFRILHYMLYG